MKRPNSRSELMKRSSRSLIMACIGRSSRISRAGIVRETGLSRAHVYAIVDQLIAEGEVIESAAVSTGRGRPKTLLELNSQGTRVGAVWLAEDLIEVAVGGADGKTISRQTLGYSGDSGRDVDSIVASLAECAEQAGSDVAGMRGVGVVVAGLVNPALGVICCTTHPEHSFIGVPIAKVLHERLGIPVVADTDIRAAALADQWNNVERERILYVQVGEGLGAAFVVAGELFGGAHVASPLLGYTPIRGDMALEECVSDYAFVDNLWPGINARKLGATEFHRMVRRGIDMAMGGDRSALDVIEEIANYMGLGMIAAISMLDPQRVHLTGTLIDSFPELMLDIIRRKTLSRIDPLLFGVEIQPLVGWRDFGLRGAYGLVLLDGFRTLNREIGAQMIAPWRSGADEPIENDRPALRAGL